MFTWLHIAFGMYDDRAHSRTRYATAKERLPSNVTVGAGASEERWRWWTLFGSLTLDRTVEAAIAGSPTGGFLEDWSAVVS
jgi:hypothetical protein